MEKNIDPRQQPIRDMVKEFADKVDVIYQTRPQLERGTEIDPNDKSFCMIDKEVLNMMKKDAIIIHPLPRLKEIPIYVDNDHRAKYFKQAEYGLYIRMALLQLILG